MQVQADAPEPGLRDAKKRSTRRALGTAARDLVLEHGLDAVTIEQIAGVAGVSVRTFFNYFESKEVAIIGGDTPLGTEETRTVFLAGGPTGDLLKDLFALFDPDAAFREEGRAEIEKVHRITMREPKVLAATLSRLHAQERQTADLIAARDGWLANGTGQYELMAGVALNLLLRSTFLWFDDETLTLAAAFDQARLTAAELLGPPTTPGPPSASA